MHPSEEPRGWDRGGTSRRRGERTTPPRNPHTPQWHRRGREDGVKGPRGDAETAGNGGRPRRSVRDAEQVERRRRRRHFFTRALPERTRQRSRTDAVSSGPRGGTRSTAYTFKRKHPTSSRGWGESGVGCWGGRGGGGGRRGAAPHQAPSPAEAPAVEEELDH